MLPLSHLGGVVGSSINSVKGLPVLNDILSVNLFNFGNHYVKECEKNVV